MSMYAMKKSYPSYTISKNKIQLTTEIDTDKKLNQLSEKYKNYRQNNVDGSKIELEKGIPSVSFNLKHGGSILINRKKSKEAIDKLEAFGKRLTEKNHSVIIFPEGTRSKNGQMRKFHRSGLLALLKTMPNAYIVPISINNAWKFSQQNYFPMTIGNDLSFTFHEPFNINQNKKEELIDTLQSIIKKGLNL